MTGKRKIVSGIAIAAAVLSAGVYMSRMESSDETGRVVYQEETVQFGDMTQHMTESGSISLITKEQRYDVTVVDSDDNDDDDEESRYLKVEAVYVKQGQRVQAGDPILKLTEQSIRSARRYLEAKQAEAEIALEELQNAYAAEQVAAGGTYQKSMTDALWSETAYAVDLAQIQAEIAQLTDSVSVLQAEIARIETELEEGWDDYADIKEAYETYERRYQEWDKDNLYTYIPLRTEYLAAKERYETETESRQDKRQEIADKQEEIQEKEADIIRLQDKSGRREMEAGQTYDKAVLDGSIAEETYASTLQALERNIETIQEEVKTFQEKLADFDAFTGTDGMVYAESDGLITEVYYEAGDSLQEESALFAYAQQDSCTISIDISEEDISAVEIGDMVEVVLHAWPDEVYTGCVKEIVSTETSRSSATVSYPVTVQISGDTTKLYGGMTGDVPL